jgi:hypothetical protein
LHTPDADGDSKNSLTLFVCSFNRVVYLLATL